MRKTNLFLTALLILLAGAKAYASDSVKDAKAESADAEAFSATLGGISASAAAQSVAVNAEEFPDREIYVEYGIKRIVERQYGPFLVRIFFAEHPAQAFGLYSFYRDPIAVETNFGAEGDIDVVDGVVRFWQGVRYVQVIDSKRAEGAGGASAEDLIKLAHSVSQRLSELDAKTLAASEIEEAKELPSVVRHLPKGSLRHRTARYFLGPRAFARSIGTSIDQYEFYPDFGTEVAMGTYGGENDRMRLLIIEYHTPQQASSAFALLNKYRDELGAEQQAKLIVKRQGNYVVEASGFAEKAAADKAIGEVKYDYVVKWLSGDSFLPNLAFKAEAAKTAQMLISVFSIIGIVLMIAFMGGVSVGLLKFYLRRRRLGDFDTFSDGGGMVRLNLDGLALPEPQSNRKLLKG